MHDKSETITKPALHKTEHGAEHFCKFNMAYIINKGHYGDTDLAGVKYWVAGDLGKAWKIRPEYSQTSLIWVLPETVASR